LFKRYSDAFSDFLKVVYFRRFGCSYKLLTLRELSLELTLRVAPAALALTTKILNMFEN
jgi:hypothetical protein